MMNDKSHTLGKVILLWKIDSDRLAVPKKGASVGTIPGTMAVNGIRWIWLTAVDYHPSARITRERTPMVAKRCRDGRRFRRVTASWIRPMTRRVDNQLIRSLGLLSRITFTTVPLHGDDCWLLRDPIKLHLMLWLRLPKFTSKEQKLDWKTPNGEDGVICNVVKWTKELVVNDGIWLQQLKWTLTGKCVTSIRPN